MPYTQQQADAFALMIRRTYEEAEARMLVIVASRLARGIDADGWAEQKLREIQRVRKQLDGEGEQLTLFDQQVTEEIDAAYQGGADGGTAALRKAGIGSIDETLPDATKLRLQVLARDTVAKLQTGRMQILRKALDGYRDVASRADALLLTGAVTRRQAAQTLLDGLADKGITGFTDVAGRSWDLASYAEMSVRTGAGQAVRQGRLDRFVANDKDLVIISDSPEECEICMRHEGKIYSISGQSQEYPPLSGAITDGLFHTNCVIGETLVTGPRPLATFSREYHGQVIVIRTASEIEITLTPNHPVLTPKGWVAVRMLQEGNQVIRYLGTQGALKGSSDYVDVPSQIKEIEQTFRITGGMLTAEMPTSAEDFHGDGEGSEVYIVLTDGLLGDNLDAETCKPVIKEFFRGVGAREAGLPTDGALAQFVPVGFSAGSSDMRVSGKGFDFIGGHALNPAIRRFTSTDSIPFLPDPVTHGTLVDPERISDVILPLTSEVATDNFRNKDRFLSRLDELARFLVRAHDTSLVEAGIDGRTGDSVESGDIGNALTLQITADTIISVNRRVFRGHVYNLQTVTGWFACNSIITHNCTHDAALFTPGLTTIPKGTENPKGYAERQKQRGIERNIRHWKKREAVAITPAAQVKAHAKVREWQGNMRTFIDDTDRLRQSGREQIGKAR